MFELHYGPTEKTIYNFLNDAMGDLVIKTITNSEINYFQPYIKHPTRSLEYYLDHSLLLEMGYENRHALSLLQKPEKAFFAIKQIYVYKQNEYTDNRFRNIL